MTEREEDRPGGRGGGGMGARKRSVWMTLQLQLGLQDAFVTDEIRRVTEQKFSWDNNRDAPNTILRRLDRIYISPAIRNFGGRTGIWPRLAHVSDHAPVFLSVRAREGTTARFIPFNKLLLRMEQGKKRLIEA